MQLRKLISITFCCFFILSCSKQGTLLHDAAGNTIKLSSLKDKWVVINFWASWCDSCAAEVPQLNYFYQHNTKDNIVLLGANYDQLMNADLQSAINKLQINYPVLIEDPNQIWQLGETSVLPTSYIINPVGQLAKKIIGPVTAEDLSRILAQLQQNEK